MTIAESQTPAGVSLERKTVMKRGHDAHQTPENLVSTAIAPSSKTIWKKDNILMLSSFHIELRNSVFCTS